MVEITLTGNIPSKKNSRIRTSHGSYIPSKEFTEWQEDAMKQVRTQIRGKRFLKPVSVDLTVIFGRRSRSDLDNRLTSVLDMLVEMVVLRDDRFQYVPQMSVGAKYRKNQPGAIIRIAEIDPAEFERELEQIRASQTVEDCYCLCCTHRAGA